MYCKSACYKITETRPLLQSKSGIPFIPFLFTSLKNGNIERFVAQHYFIVVDIVWQWKMHQHFLKMLLPFTLMCIIYIFIEIQWCMHTLTFFLCCFAFLKKWLVISKNMIYGFWTRDDDEDDDDIVLVTEHILNSRIRYHKCKLSL